jgi:hypothetical protein
MVYERKKLNIPIWFMRKKLKSEMLMDVDWSFMYFYSYQKGCYMYF